jgi:UDP-GlcNAc:undecaprenyl-phosphate GlcNAc-1-phosphate transferase
MVALLALMTALVISVAAIPLLIRLAPRIGMVDLPDPRKVHHRPVPRVGGLGIALGALVAVALFVPLDTLMYWYLFGALVLLVFGALDDALELGHWVKFAGQFVAVIPLVVWGELWVERVPFLDDPLPAWIGMPFTVVAIIGVINAINHSDGLDGLASGESLMSFGAITFLAYLAGGVQAVIFACAVMGGILGFLRFNTHPARVFMGDAGSQFIGYTLGVLVVLLTQKINPALSMALPALLLGLPVIDIVAVFAQRIRQGLNWFKATRNHIHHRLLEIGFAHYQAVLIIYLVQAVMTVNAVNLAYESDALILALYFGLCALVFGGLLLAERRGWRADREGRDWVVLGMVRRVHDSHAIAVLPEWFVRLSVPVFIVLASFAVQGLSYDLKVALAAIGVTLLVYVPLRRMQHGEFVARLAIYALVPMLLYSVHANGAAAFATAVTACSVYVAVLAVCVMLAAKFSAARQEFAPTTMDFLLVGAVLAAVLFLPGLGDNGGELASLVLQVVVLLYGCELIMRMSRSGTALLSGAAAASLAVIAVRGAI